MNVVRRLWKVSSAVSKHNSDFEVQACTISYTRAHFHTHTYTRVVRLRLGTGKHPGQNNITRKKLTIPNRNHGFQNMVIGIASGEIMH